MEFLIGNLLSNKKVKKSGDIMERIYSLDFVKFFAILAVVIIHAPPFSGNLGIVLNTLSRFAVPFFFATSGYFFTIKFTHNNNHNNHFIKTVVKLIKIYFCWLAIYFAYDASIIILTNYIDGASFTHGFNILLGKVTILSLFYYAGASSGYQLWFLPALIWSTVALFVSLKIKIIEFLFVVSLLLNLVGLFGESYSGLFNLSIETRDAIFFGLFYTVLGGMIAKYYKPYISKQSKIYLYFFIFFLILQVIERYILIQIYAEISGANYFVSTIFLTLFLMVFLINNPLLGKKSFLTTIGSNSLGIFVIHLLIISLSMTLMTVFNIDNLKEYKHGEMVYTLFIFVASHISYTIIQNIKGRVLTLVGKKSAKESFF
jgi:surface polysaccharide O-acyltransferase-like enzyme